MRCIGEQHFVSVDEAFDPSGGLIEALRQARDLVAPLDPDARAQIAGSKRFDAALQPLEASGEPSDDGTGADRDHNGDGPKEGREHERAGALPKRKAGHQPPTVGQRNRNSAPRRRSLPTSGTTAGAGRRKWSTGCGQRLVGAAIECQICAEAPGQPVDRLLLHRERRIRHRDKFGDDFAGNLERLAERGNARAEMPEHARREDDEDQASHDRQIYLKIEPFHPSLSIGALRMRAASILGFGKHVARAAQRDDAPRFSWIVLDRGADAGD
jgi:hypothetical protein